MAETLCQLEKKGGGKLRETVLWTNPSPTTAFPITRQALSNSTDSFSYI